MTHTNRAFYLALLSILMLTGAVVSEHLFDAQPCYNCVVERAWFLSIAIFSVLMLFTNKLILLIGVTGNVASFILLGMTFYDHIGTDLGWWISTCGVSAFWLSEYIPYIFEVKGICGMNTFTMLGIDMLYWAVTGAIIQCLIFISALPSAYKYVFWYEK